MKVLFLKLALLSLFCLALATVNGQNTLSDEAVKVIKELKKVDTKGLSDEESATVINVLNQLKKQHSSQTAHFVPVVAERGAVAKVGSAANPIQISMSNMVPVQSSKKKFILDGHETSGAEFSKVMYTRGKENVNLKIVKDKESLAKYNAQGYDEVWILEPVKAKKPTSAPGAKAAEPVNKTEARVGTAENPMDISMMTSMMSRGGVKQTRVKYILDGREITSSKYWDMMAVRGNSSGFKTKMFKDKESLAKYNAQGYDEVLVLETVKVEKSTTPRVTKFKQNGNQVSFRIEVPKTENAKKQKININYTLPNM